LGKWGIQDVWFLVTFLTAQGREKKKVKKSGWRPKKPTNLLLGRCVREVGKSRR